MPSSVRYAMPAAPKLASRSVLLRGAEIRLLTNAGAATPRNDRRFIRMLCSSVEFESVLAQEFANRLEDLCALVRLEIAVLAAGDGQQLVRHAGLGEGLVQAHGVSVGHGRIGIAVDSPRCWLHAPEWPPILPKAFLNGNRVRGSSCRTVIPVDLVTCTQHSFRAFPVWLLMNMNRWWTARQKESGRLALLGVLCGLVLAVACPGDLAAKTKAPRVPRPEPELKILDLNITPTPYTPSNGQLQFAVTVQLPKEEWNGATILEVSSLISSPSKTSLRFLSHRQGVHVPAPALVGGVPPKLALQLTWDGQDHRKQLAGPGQYAYEVRIKLLANGEKGRAL